jgi:hypothetical protein
MLLYQNYVPQSRPPSTMAVVIVQSVPITTKWCEFESRAWRGVLDTTLCDEISQWVSPVPSSNRTDRHDIAEILLKVALNITYIA